MFCTHHNGLDYLPPLGVVLGVSLVGSIGTMWGAMSVSPERPLLKHALWLVRTPLTQGWTSKSHIDFV